MSDEASDILIIGYGNPGRQDDALGPALADEMERLPGVSVDSDYQLTVEHAEMAARHQVVVFADATMQSEEPFTWNRVEPSEAGIRFTSHHLGPADVLALARDLFDAHPDGYVLAIRGRRFGEFDVGLSPDGQAALEDAVQFLTAKIRDMIGAVSHEL
jgi:hydrogenase maturation protease